MNVSAVLDAMGIKEIFQNTSEHTSKDPILNELRKLIKSDKNYIPKKNPNLNPYGDILSESVSNGTLVNHDKIKKVIKLAHSGVHRGQNGLIRRLRSHLIMKSLKNKLAEYVNSCSYCQMFTNNVYRHPITSNKAPERCWEETSVDRLNHYPVRIILWSFNTLLPFTL